MYYLSRVTLLPVSTKKTLLAIQLSVPLIVFIILKS